MKMNGLIQLKNGSLCFKNRKFDMINIVLFPSPDLNKKLQNGDTIYVWGITGKWFNFEPSTFEDNSISLSLAKFPPLIQTEDVSNVYGLKVQYADNLGQLRKTWLINILDDNCVKDLKEIYQILKGIVK